MNTNILEEYSASTFGDEVSLNMKMEAEYSSEFLVYM
jgi:hypothetical protein